MGEQYSGRKISRVDILGLKKGEVVKYSGGIKGTTYLVVDHVDLERGVVTGEMTDVFGVNALSISELEKKAIDIAKWRDNPAK